MGVSGHGLEYSDLGDLRVSEVDINVTFMYVVLRAYLTSGMLRCRYRCDFGYVPIP